MEKEKSNHNSPNWASFTGYTSPSYTNVPDQLFDEHLAFLSGAELKVLLYIVRRTFGFKKDSDNISLSQMLHGIGRRDGTVLDHGVGLTKKTLLLAIKSLQDKHLITTERRQSIERGNEPTSYRLNMASGLGVKTIPPMGEKVLLGAGELIPPSPRGNNSTTQDTVLQETDKQDIDPSNVRDIPTSQFVQKERSASFLLKESRESGVDEGTSQGVAGESPVDSQLAERNGNLSSSRGQKAYSEERQQILSFIEDFARELGDEAPLVSSVSRANNLWEESGIPIEAFCTLLYEARSRTWSGTANIKKTRRLVEGAKSPWGPTKNRMAYFFGVLEEIVGKHSVSSDGESTGGIVASKPGLRKQASQKRAVQAPESAIAGVSSVGEILAGRGLNPAPSGNIGRHRTLSDARQTIESYIAKMSQQFGDEAPLASSVTRAHNLFDRSGLSMARFLAHLFEAQSLTQEYSENVTKRRKGEPGPFGPEKNRMAYFFGVLESRLPDIEHSRRPQ
jgi:Bacteriophage replication protein O